MYRLGSQPLVSWRRFLQGLATFCIGLVLILLDGLPPWLAYLGMAVMGIGFIVAARGYVGIFANRFSQVLNRAGRGGAAGSKNARQE